MTRTPRRRRSAHSTGLGFLIALTAMGVTSGLAAQTPHQLVIRGIDHAFQAPDTVPAGLTMITLENRGALRHEVIVVRLKEGRTLADMMAGKTLPERLAVQDAILGMVFAEAGQRSPGRLVAELTPGRSYALICAITDPPGTPPHLQQGMVGVIHVR
jgi:hypothetical protein